MTCFVVDTNVAIAANGRDTHADVECQLTCVERLESLVAGGLVAIDEGGLIFKEYQGKLRHSGMPGVGDKFFKHVWDNQCIDTRVRRVPVTQSEDDQRGFEELPENNLDRSDRKFLAVAFTAEAVILNATDSDWDEQAPLLDSLDVEVDQLCPQHMKRREQCS